MTSMKRKNVKRKKTQKAISADYIRDDVPTGQRNWDKSKKKKNAGKRNPDDFKEYYY